MKKIKILSLVIISLLLFSCTSLKPKYSVFFYIDGVRTEFELSEYSKDSFLNGDIQLPTNVNIEPGSNCVFDGWYTDKTFKGNVVTTIEEGSTGNKIFYGRIVYNGFSFNNVNTNIKNYTVDVFNEDTKTLERTLKYSNDDKKFESFSTEYLTTIDGLKTYIYLDGETWKSIDETEDYFHLVEDYFDVCDLSRLDKNAFIFNQQLNVFNVLKEKEKEIGSVLLGSYEDATYENIFLEIKDSFIEKITLDSINLDNNTTTKYILSFSFYNETLVDIPKDVEKYTSYKPIEEVYLLKDGYSGVCVIGEVTGIYGNNFYVQDETGGLLIYCGNDASYKNQISIGSVIKVFGDVSVYKTVHQLVNLSKLELFSKKITVNSKDLESIDQESLVNEIGNLVNLNDVVLKTKPSEFPLSGSDVSFEVSLGLESIIVFVSKHLDSASKKILFDALQTFEVGDFIDISNGHIGHHNDYQLVLTNNASITPGYKPGDPVVINNLKANPSSINVEVGTTLEEVVSKITFVAYYNNGSSNNVSGLTTSSIYNPVLGTYSLLFSYEGLSVTVDVTVVEDIAEPSKIIIDHSPLLDVLDGMNVNPGTGLAQGITKGLPASGDVKVLVLPVYFTDYSFPAGYDDMLNLAFFGSSVETGWESLSSYYYKSSYGKLNISGTILEPFNCGHSSIYYEELYNTFNSEYEKYEAGEISLAEVPESAEFYMITEALEYYDSLIDYSEYDSDEDGYIDAIYVIYPNEYSYEDHTLWWAFCSDYIFPEEHNHDEVGINFYVFCSYHFLLNQLANETIPANSETIIHETGHLLGLDDYYDYDEETGPKGGIGGGDMMDYNVGDHNPFSKILLGWVNPYLIEQDTTITLNPFESSGDCLIIPKSWNGTFFDEYFVVDFYTPTGLNEFCSGISGLFSKKGVRVYHVDAKLVDPSECTSIFKLYKCNNSDTDNKLIALVEADGSNDIIKGERGKDSDLFTTHISLDYPLWNDSTSSNFVLTVLSLGNTATISIDFID